MYFFTKSAGCRAAIQPTATHQRLLASFLLMALALAGRAQAPTWQQPVSINPDGLQGRATAQATSTDAAGNQYVTGYFSGTVRLGTLVLTANGSRNGNNGSGSNGSDMFVAKRDAAGTWLWARSAGDSFGTSIIDAPLDAGHGIATDAAGNVYVCGNFMSGSTTGVAFGSLPLLYGGGPDYTLFVAKLDATGTWLWARAAGNMQPSSFPPTLSYRPATTAYSVAVAGNGEVVVAGTVLTSTTQGAQFGTLPLLYGPNSNLSTSGFVARLDAAGTWLWATAAKAQPSGTSRYSSNTLEACDVAVDAGGNAYVTGFFQGTTTNGATFGGLPTLFGLGTGTAASNIFVAKLNAAGTWLWAKAAGQSGVAPPDNSRYGVPSTAGLAVALDATGAPYLTGTCFAAATQGVQFGSLPLLGMGSSAYYQLFVARLDATGTWLWARGVSATLGSPTSSGQDIAVDAAGNAYITGTLTAGNATAITLASLPPLYGLATASQAAPHVLTASIDAAGAWRWAQRTGDPDDYDATLPIITGKALALGSGGTVHVVGQLRSQTDFGPGGPIIHNTKGPLEGKPFVLLAAELNAATGAWQAATGSEGSGSGSVWKTTHDAAGNEYVVGYFTGQMTLGTIALAANHGSQDLFVAKRDPAGTWLWAQRGGASRNAATYQSGNIGLTQNDEIARDVAVDASGNVYIVGTIAGCTSSDGATFGTLPPVAGFASCALPNGRPSLDVVVAKLDANGTWLWARAAGGAGRDVGTSLGLDGAGNVYVAGSFVGPATFGTLPLLTGFGGSNASPEAFVAKLDPSGTWLWAAQGGTPGAGTPAGDDEAAGLAVDAAGNATVVGYFTGSATAPAFFGNLAPLPGLSTTAGSDIFVARLNPAGVWQWAQAAGNASYGDAATAVVLDAAGNAFVTGSFVGSRANGGRFGSLPPLLGIGFSAGSNIFVGQLNPAGTWLWAAAAGSAGYGGLARALALDGNGAVLVTGDIISTAISPASFGNLPPLSGASFGSTPSSDIFAAKISATGTWQWATLAGGPGEDLGRSISGSGVNVYVAGSFTQDITFGATPLIGAAAITTTGSPVSPPWNLETGFLARLGPAAAVISSFTPTRGPAGTVVTLTGANFTGATAVSFNGVAVPPGSFTVTSPTTIVVTLPAGATSGFITVTTPAGVATSTSRFGFGLATREAGPLAGCSVFPNPAQGNATVLVPAVPGATTTTVSLTDALGRTVRTDTLALPAAGLRLALDLRGLAPGLYALRVQAGSAQALSRLLVE